MVKKNSSDMDIYSGETRSSPKNRRNKNSSDMDICTEEPRSVPKKETHVPQPQKKNKKRKRKETSEEKTKIRKKSSNKEPNKKVRLSILKGNVFQIDITNPDFSGSKHRGTYDCVICTLEALGILSLSQGQNQRKYLSPNGVFDHQIFNLMGNRYSGTEWKFERVHYEELESFLNEIRPNHAIFAKLEGPDCWHAVVFYKSKNNKLGMMDFQINPVLNIVGYEKIKKEYLEEYEFKENFFEVLTCEFV